MIAEGRSAALKRRARILVEEERLKAILESLLFAAGEPVALAQLVSAIETVPRDEIRHALGAMIAAGHAGARGCVLEEVAGGYQLRTPREHAAYVRRLLASKPPRLSRPLLETVAIIAYRQPITRPEIELLRGVDCGGVLDTLTERNLVKIEGRKEAPGRPLMYVTTPEFLELFGLKDLASLPDLAELRAVEGARDDPDRMPDGNGHPPDEAAAPGESAGLVDEAVGAAIDAAADALAERAAESSSDAASDAAPFGEMRSAEEPHDAVERPATEVVEPIAEAECAAEFAHEAEAPGETNFTSESEPASEVQFAPAETAEPEPADAAEPSDSEDQE